MSTTEQLNIATGFLFFAGFMLSKLQYVPFPLVSAICRFLSLGLYLTGYGLWFISNLLLTGHKQSDDKWYGFAKIKEQLLYSSLIGFVATVFSVAAVFVPVLFPPAAWLFFIGNVIWAISEYHKLKNPPEDENFSYTKQNAYQSYAMTNAAISLVSAVAATLIFVFPLIAIPITISSLLLCIGLGVLASEYWLSAYFGDHKPLKDSDSHRKMSNELGYTHEKKHSPAPHHKKNFLFNPKEKNDKLIEMAPMSHLKKEGLKISSTFSHSEEDGLSRSSPL